VRNRLRALACATALLLTPTLAQASEPDSPESPALEGPLEGPARADALADMAETAGVASFALEQPALLDYLPGPAAFIGPPPVHAKRARERKFDTSMGETDPRTRQRPRTHRFRLAIHAQHVRLTRTQNTETGELVRFHYAPMMLDLAYQAQFLKFVMVRLAVAAGYNVANTRHGMPGTLFPQIYAGYSGKIIGLAFGYGFDWTIPPTFQATDPSAPSSLQEPVITRNHVVMGELSATSKIDRVAMTFALALGGIQSDISHYDLNNRKWRLYLGLQAGVYFDGTIRREKKARKKAEAEGR
jgi:hypothetical protein